MTQVLNPIDVAGGDDFGVLFQRVNDLIDIMGTQAVTVGSTTGNVGLIGTFTASTLSTVSLTTNNILSSNSSPIVVGSTVEFKSANSISTTFENISGAKTQYKNNLITWEAGVKNADSTSDFVVRIAGGADRLAVSPLGVVTAGSELRVPTANTYVLTSDNNITVSPTNQLLVQSSATFSGANTVFSSAAVNFTGAQLTIDSSVAVAINAVTNFSRPITVANTAVFSSPVTVNANTTIAGTTMTVSANTTFTKTITGNISGSAQSANTVPFTGVSGKPNTISGYGITDGITNSTTQPFDIYITKGQPMVTLTNTSSGSRKSGIRMQGDVFYITKNNAGDPNLVALGDSPLQINLNTNDATFKRHVTAEGEVTALSDRRLKDDIITIEGALKRLRKLRGVSYVKDGRRSVGVIAQEIEKEFPEVVHEAGGYKSVAYGNMIGPLIAAINELADKVEGLYLAKNQ